MGHKKEDFPFRMPCFEHQQFHFDKRTEETAWGLLWEQGVGKTKAIADSASWLYHTRKIDGLLVVAPPGVERNWANEQLQEHMPHATMRIMDVGVFHTAKKATKAQKLAMQQLLNFDGLAVMLISYNAFMTKEGKLAVNKFLDARKVMYVLDEAHFIKTPNAKRTKSIVSSGKYAVYRRILTGTPVSQGSFDIYSQVKFLDEDFWKREINISNFFAFKAHFGEFIQKGGFHPTKHYKLDYPLLVRYKNVEQLNHLLSKISDRVVKADVLDLPPKLYKKRYVTLSPEQKAIYKELVEEMVYEFDDGSYIDGELAIVRLLRLQQIICNYVSVFPDGDDLAEPILKHISEKNPRLDALEEIIDETHTPGIIWARFREDINQIMALMEKKGVKAVRYDGTINADEAEANKVAFQKGEVQWFVSSPQKGGTGLTLHQAKVVVYYSNSFKLIDRMQSEDRAHRAGMDKNPVLYIDLVCEDTVDEKIVNALCDKKNVASEILGDDLNDWIR